MVLGLGDIACFVANWENKADNIRDIAESLGIGLDSLVFIDDNPVERDLVRTMLPMVSVPEMPDDPALFIRAIDREHFVETAGFSEEDRRRAAMYMQNAERKHARKAFANLGDFLEQLEMEAEVGDFDAAHLPRIAQLINKSNQFHLTTTRYSEAEISRMMGDDSLIRRFFKLSDRHGDNGLISLVILRREDGGDLGIDTWVMSCRVLSRQMEEFVHNEIVRLARARGCGRIVGKYIPTPNNKLVAGLYGKLGFEKIGEEDGASLWEKAVGADTALMETHIKQLA